MYKVSLTCKKSFVSDVCTMADFNSNKLAGSRKYYRIFVIATCVFSTLLLISAITTYFWLTSERQETFQCDFSELEVISKFTPNWLVSNNGVSYPTGRDFNRNNTLRDCACVFKPCIRKCCNDGEFYVKVPKKPAFCQTNSIYDHFKNLTIPVYSDSWQLVDLSPDHFQVLYGDVCPYGKYMLYPEDIHHLMADGRVSMEESDGSQTYLDTSQYCFETMNGTEQEIQTFICFQPTETKEDQVMFILYPIGMMISIPFMVVTIMVYGLVSELRNLHGKSLMSQTTSLCITYIGLFIIQVGRDGVTKFWCIFLAFTVQFTFLASFFWMNVMCFDIWWVFSGLRAPRGSAKERDHKKFVMYSVYAWGVPALILAISLVMDLASFIPDNLIKPGFGEIKCWFKDAAGTVLYFYLPIATVVLLNTAMFLSTACKLRAHSKETKVLKSSESRQSSRADQDRFDVYLKLFVVMGINWVMELVSFFAGGPKSLWFVTDIGNTLQGVLIFLIFVCKRRVIRLVKQKLLPRWATSSSSAPSQTGSSRTNSTLVSKTV